MQTITYVRGADRMITAARLLPTGLFVRFADRREGVVPFDELDLPATAREVRIPAPHVVVLLLANGSEEEVPWDFARHFVDSDYRGRSEAAAATGKRLLGERLKALRAERGVTQEELAERAGVSRSTVARLETGGQSPRYATLEALAKALQVPFTRLFPGADDHEGSDGA